MRTMTNTYFVLSREWTSPDDPLRQRSAVWDMTSSKAHAQRLAADLMQTHPDRKFYIQEPA